MSFVSSLIHHTKQYESPTAFWKWSAYSAISAVLRDNVFFVDGDSRLYPNIYVLFVAGSAQRKGRPVTFAEHLIALVNNVKVISGRSSIQAILMDIGQSETDKSGVMVPGGSAIFVAPELSAGIVQDDDSIQILTDIYDFKPTGHTSNLIGRGKSKLDKLVFSMLGASNEELLKSLYSIKAIHGGLLGRTFLVKPDEFRVSNAFPEANETGFQELVGLLKELAGLKGTFQFSWEAKEFFRVWYEEFRPASSKKPDRAGVLGRLPTNVKKLATILAANDVTQIVELRHVDQAIAECLILLPNYNTYVLASGKSKIAEAGGILLESLHKMNGMLLDRRQIIRDNWQNFDIETFDGAVTAFETSGLIKIEQSGSNMYYKLTPQGLDMLGEKSNEQKPVGKSYEQKSAGGVGF